MAAPNTFLEWLSNLPDRLWGFVDKIRDWSKEQKIFFYSLVFTLLISLYLIVLPRYDCFKFKSQKACEFIELDYQKKIETLK